MIMPMRVRVAVAMPVFMVVRMGLTVVVSVIAFMPVILRLRHGMLQAGVITVGARGIAAGTVDTVRIAATGWNLSVGCRRIVGHPAPSYRRSLRSYADYCMLGGCPGGTQVKERDVADGEPDQVELAVEVFRMLADATRVRLILALRDHGELPVNRLAELVAKPAPAVSQHLAKLRLTRLVATRQDGTRVFYRLTSEHAGQLVTDAMYQAEHTVSEHPAHHTDRAPRASGERRTE